MQDLRTDDSELNGLLERLKDLRFSYRLLYLGENLARSLPLPQSQLTWAFLQQHSLCKTREMQDMKATPIFHTLLRRRPRWRSRNGPALKGPRLIRQSIGLPLRE